MGPRLPASACRGPPLWASSTAAGKPTTGLAGVWASWHVAAAAGTARQQRRRRRCGGGNGRQELTAWWRRCNWSRRWCGWALPYVCLVHLLAGAVCATCALALGCAAVVLQSVPAWMAPCLPRSSSSAVGTRPDALPPLAAKAAPLSGEAGAVYHTSSTCTTHQPCSTAQHTTLSLTAPLLRRITRTCQHCPVAAAAA